MDAVKNCRALGRVMRKNLFNCGFRIHTSRIHRHHRPVIVVNESLPAIIAYYTLSVHGGGAFRNAPEVGRSVLHHHSSGERRRRSMNRSCPCRSILHRKWPTTCAKGSIRKRGHVFVLTSSPHFLNYSPADNEKPLVTTRRSFTSPKRFQVNQGKSEYPLVVNCEMES